MSLVSAIRAMRAAGISAEAILETVIGMEEERLAKGRARTAKHRNNKDNRDVTDVTGVTGVTPPETKVSPAPPSKTQPLPTPEKKTPPTEGQKKGPSPREKLLAVLDAEHAAAVLDHRQRIRRPLTAHAAGLLAGKLAQWPDPNEAADAMIANGWQGFEPGWLRNRGNGTRAPPSKPKSMSARLSDLADKPISELFDDPSRDP